ncbi:MAG: hypothetical protein MI919_03780, partial [Holophagales bacterium]|nr:hypothetical protein [Holophagales bacterium]
MASEFFPQLAGRFEAQIRGVEALDIRVPEDSALIGLAADLVPKVTRLLRESIDLMQEVEVSYDPSRAHIPRPDDVDTLQHIGLMISAELATRDLTDMAYFARMELRGALQKLEAAATRDRNELVLASSCEAGLRCARKALVSVESAFFELEEAQAPPRQWFDVELSLQIRKLYWNLRRETGGHNIDHRQPLEERLRSVLYRIVAFRE